jgi:hypothetical protein
MTRQEFTDTAVVLWICHPVTVLALCFAWPIFVAVARHRLKEVMP